MERKKDDEKIQVNKDKAGYISYSQCYECWKIKNFRKNVKLLTFTFFTLIFIVQTFAHLTIVFNTLLIFKLLNSKIYKIIYNNSL